MVIFKQKNMPKETFPPGVVVKVHPKGWMDEAPTKVWLDEVFIKRPGGLLKPRCLLVWARTSETRTRIAYAQPLLAKAIICTMKVLLLY